MVSLTAFDRKMDRSIYWGTAMSNSDVSSTEKPSHDSPCNLDPETHPDIVAVENSASSESSPFSGENLNQNRAYGADSDVSSCTPGNTVLSSSTKEQENYLESELRGGSTMSDLHHTERINDNSPTKRGILRQTPKSASSRFREDTSMSKPSTAHPTKSEPSSRRPESSAKNRPKKRSGSRRSGSSMYSLSSGSQSDLSDMGLRTPAPIFIEPDPTSSRDLDNASPRTIDLCGRHAVHYCFFVYFPPATVSYNSLVL